MEKLIEIETRPWSEWSKGRPISKNQLAGQLEPFKIKPKSIRIGTTTLKGYLKEWFKDAFERYLPIDPSHRNNPQETAEKQPIRSVTQLSHVTDEHAPKTAENSQCYGVTDRLGGYKEGEVFDL